MNIQNVLDLSKQLIDLGFPDLSASLAKRICFKPERFSLFHQVQKEDHAVSFRLSFEITQSTGDYQFVFYDAALQNTVASSQTINGVSIALLLEEMGKVNWRKAFDLTDAKTSMGMDETAFETELRVETIIDALATLASSEDGRGVALALKHKYWASTAYYEVVGSLPPFKSKTEVSQRFYFFERQPVISLDEAYRYLQNRLIEKEISARKKHMMSTSTENLEGGTVDNSSSRKRRKKAKTTRSEL